MILILSHGIDPDKIRAERIGVQNKLYTIDELKHIARQLGLFSGGSKLELVRRIRNYLGLPPE